MRLLHSVTSSLGGAAVICAGLALASGAASASYKNPPDPYGPPATAKWIRAHRGQPLDLSGYRQTFDDEFDSVASISDDGGKGPWFAPIHSTAGAAKFRPPSFKPSPFSVSDGVLTLRAEKVNGGWQTGHMQTSDSKGRGFSQKYGYFEIRMKLPPPGSKGAWPAFWLYSTTRFTDPSRTRAEIDILENYPGHNPGAYRSGVHLRPGKPYRKGEVSKHWKQTALNHEIEGLTDGKWHTYGALVTPEWIIVYFDRKEEFRFPTLKEFKTPLYMLVSNQMLKSEQPEAISPIDLKVDYVRVWAKK